jgi:hypothetical protein
VSGNRHKNQNNHHQTTHNEINKISEAQIIVTDCYTSSFRIDREIETFFLKNRRPRSERIYRIKLIKHFDGMALEN